MNITPHSILDRCAITFARRSHGAFTRRDFDAMIGMANLLRRQWEYAT